MRTFKGIKNFSLHEQHDEKIFYDIVSKNLNTGAELTKLLSETLDFEFSPIGEIFVKFDKKNIADSDLKLLEKYFNITKDKFGSRGLGYYGLFGKAYEVKNRKEYTKNPKEVLNSFWNEYEEYINILNKIKDNEQLQLVYLDNYRNFLLLWSYIFVIIKRSNKNKFKTTPINNLAFQNINNEEKITKILDNLIGLYEMVLKNILNISLEKDNSNIFMLADIKDLFKQIKKLFDEEKIILTKKGKKTTLNEFFTQNENNIKIWIEKVFRNIREEDNLGIILSFFLQNKINLNDPLNKSKIKKLIYNFQKKEKNEYILSAMYGGIEFGLVAKYLGYESGWINFSTYHLKNKNTYRDINEIIYPLTKIKKLNNQQTILVDDNLDTGNTLDKIRNILHNNHIPVKLLAVPRIKLSKIERQEIKSGKINTDKEIFEIKKHVGLNSLYLLPRTDKKGRKINVFMKKKIGKFRKNFNREFRSL